MNKKRAILWPTAVSLILSFSFSNAYESLTQPVMPPPVSKQKEKILKPLFKDSKVIGGQVIALKGSPGKRYSGNYVDVGTLGGVKKGDIFAVYMPNGTPVGFLKITEPQRFTSTFEFVELQVDASENLVVKKVPEEIGTQLPGSLQVSPRYAALRKKPVAPKLPTAGAAPANMPVLPEGKGMPALPEPGAPEPAMPALPSGELPSLPGLEAAPVEPAGQLPSLPAASQEPSSLPPLESGAAPALPGIAEPAPAGTAGMELPPLEGAGEPAGAAPMEGMPALPSAEPSDLPPLEGGLPAAPPPGDKSLNLAPIGRPEDLGSTPPDFGDGLALPPSDGLPVPEPQMNEMDLSPVTDLPPPGAPPSDLPPMDLGLPTESVSGPPGMDMGLPPGPELAPPPGTGSDLDLMMPPDMGAPPLGGELPPPGGELPPLGAAPDLGGMPSLDAELPPPGGELDMAGMPPGMEAPPAGDMMAGADMMAPPPDLGGMPSLDAGLPPPSGELDMAGMPPGMEAPPTGDMMAGADMMAPPPDLGGMPSLDAGLPPPGGELDMAGMPPMDMGVPSPDLAPPSLDAGFGVEPGAVPPGLSLPGVTSTAQTNLRMDLPSMPTDVPLKKDPIQDLPTLQAKRPAV